jgi:hypothetical protein
MILHLSDHGDCSNSVGSIMMVDAIGATNGAD